MTSFLKSIVSGYDWILFFDVDEFLVLKNGKTDIKSFLQEYDEFNAIAFYWRLFTGRTIADPVNKWSVTERFLQCEPNLSKVTKIALHIKTMPEGTRFESPHRITNVEDLKTMPFDWLPKTVDASKHVLRGNTLCSENHNDSLNIAYISHYRFKTYQEMEMKFKNKTKYFYGSTLNFKILENEFYRIAKIASFIDLSALRFMETGKFLPENYKKIVDLPDLKIMSYSGADLHLGRLITLLRSLKPGNDFDSSLADR